MSTIVGSWPHRRTLPDGAEANARALRMCRFWRRPTVYSAALSATTRHVDLHDDLDRVSSDCLLAQRRRNDRVFSVSAGWLPASAHDHQRMGARLTAILRHEVTRP